MTQQVVQNQNELTTEIAERLAAPIVELVRWAPDDQAAKGIILLIRAVAREDNAEVRKLFANDVAERIFAETFSARDAAMAFAA